MSCLKINKTNVNSCRIFVLANFEILFMKIAMDLLQFIFFIEFERMFKWTTSKLHSLFSKSPSFKPISFWKAFSIISLKDKWSVFL